MYVPLVCVADIKEIRPTVCERLRNHKPEDLFPETECFDSGDEFFVSRRFRRRLPGMLIVSILRFPVFWSCSSHTLGYWPPIIICTDWYRGVLFQTFFGSIKRGLFPSVARVLPSPRGTVARLWPGCCRGKVLVFPQDCGDVGPAERGPPCIADHLVDRSDRDFDIAIA